MSFVLMRKLLLLPIRKIWGSSEGQGGKGQGGKDWQRQQVRHHAPIVGPPRFPMSPGKKLILGWGPLLIMMIIPFWALFQVPHWSALHNGIVPEEKEPVEEQPPPEPEKDDKNKKDDKKKDEKAEKKDDKKKKDEKGAKPEEAEDKNDKKKKNKKDPKEEEKNEKEEKEKKKK